MPFEHQYPAGSGRLPVPSVLVVSKRGRDRVMGKLVRINGTPVLATPYRNRQAVRQAASLPEPALLAALASGATHWIVRFDHAGEALAIPIADVLTNGKLVPTDGCVERYVPLTWFEPIPFPQWPYVEQPVVRLPGALPTSVAPALPSAGQLTMFGEPAS